MTGEEGAIVVLAAISIVLMLIPYGAPFGVPFVLLAIVLLLINRFKPPTRPDSD